MFRWSITDTHTHNTHNPYTSTANKKFHHNPFHTHTSHTLHRTATATAGWSRRVKTSTTPTLLLNQPTNQIDNPPKYPSK